MIRSLIYPLVYLITYGVGLFLGYQMGLEEGSKPQNPPSEAMIDHYESVYPVDIIFEEEDGLWGSTQPTEAGFLVKLHPNSEWEVLVHEMAHVDAILMGEPAHGDLWGLAYGWHFRAAVGEGL